MVFASSRTASGGPSPITTNGGTAIVVNNGGARLLARVKAFVISASLKGKERPGPGPQQDASRSASRSPHVFPRVIRASTPGARLSWRQKGRRRERYLSRRLPGGRQSSLARPQRATTTSSRNLSVTLVVAFTIDATATAGYSPRSRSPVAAAGAV